ncbi:MAG TPA: zf-HC2 domain-containing protein, partial [Solirubrobacteraceae bacterium]|nr:zf-HC2 domain-containing protein [Solirubrobacteraceae bacterium]
MVSTRDPLAALEARVSAVAGALPERERRALALRERDGAGYSAIASALDVPARDVPALLWRARLAVRDGVRAAPLPAATSDACPRARRLLTLQQDGELTDHDAMVWLREHVQDCGSCRAVRRALREASLAFRAAPEVGADRPPSASAAAAAPAAPAPAPAAAPPTAPRAPAPAA